MTNSNDKTTEDEPKPRNAALELCNKLQRRNRVMRDRRKRRAKAKRNDYKDPANW